MRKCKNEDDCPTPTLCRGKDKCRNEKSGEGLTFAKLHKTWEIMQDDLPPGSTVDPIPEGFVEVPPSEKDGSFIPGGRFLRAEDGKWVSWPAYSDGRERPAGCHATSGCRVLRPGSATSERLMWTQAEAITLCIEIERIAPNYGCHVGLTGGLLYKTGPRKDCDLILYRIRQVPEVEYAALFAALETIGITNAQGFGFIFKAQYQGKGIDFLLPEEEGEYDPDAAGGDNRDDRPPEEGTWDAWDEHVAQEAPDTLCPHGFHWNECAECDHAGDLAYDAARESRGR